MKIAKLKNLEFIPSTHEDPDKPGVVKKVLFAASDFDDDCGLKMLNYAVIKPGDSFALHYHETMEEVFYILKGQAKIEIDGETAELTANMAVVIPKNSQHIMTNIGDTDLEYLAFGAAPKLGRTIVISD